MARNLSSVGFTGEMLLQLARRYGDVPDDAAFVCFEKRDGRVYVIYTHDKAFRIPEGETICHGPCVFTFTEEVKPPPPSDDET